MARKAASKREDEWSAAYRRPEWQKKRLEVMERAGFVCQECGSKDTELHVHHCWYERGKAPWEYPDKCFRVLCGPCHDKRHEVQHEVAMAMAPYDTKHLETLGCILADGCWEDPTWLSDVNVLIGILDDVGGVSLLRTSAAIAWDMVQRTGDAYRRGVADANKGASR